MADYKKNHTIPKMMLRYWVDPGTPYESTHVYDIQKKRMYQSAGKGGTPFSFAIQNDLHVPVVDSKRAVALEQWFSNLEGALASFVRQAHKGTLPFTFKTAEERMRALLGLVALEYRSRYDLALIQKRLESDNQLLSILTSADGTEPKKATLENLIHLVTEKALAIQPTEFTFLHAPSGHSWITCDRPCLNLTWKSEPAKFVVLTNKVIAMYRLSPTGEDELQHITLNESVATPLNRDIALNARDWIVADSLDLLKQVTPIIGSPDWQKRVDDDHLNQIPIEHLRTGWKIPSPP